MFTKYFFSVLALIIVLSVNGICQVKLNKPVKQSSQKTVVKKCSENSDSLYNRESTLKQFAETLNSTATSYYNARYSKKKKIAEANVKNERPVGFSVYDLVVDSNDGVPLGKCIEFKDSHIYHFALISIPYSFSHIAVLEKGKIKIFKAVNCKDGDSLEDVKNYLKPRLRGNEDEEEIIKRVTNYRNYGIYYSVDDTSLRCQEADKNKN
jgi:hypothetical protein